MTTSLNLCTSPCKRCGEPVYLGRFRDSHWPCVGRIADDPVVFRHRDGRPECAVAADSDG